MLPNASWLEIGWSASSLAGLALALVLLALNTRDESRRRRAGVNGHVRLEVQGDIVLALGLSVVEGLFFIAGVVQMGLPTRPDAAWPPTAVGILVVLSSFIAANLVVGALVVDRLTRRRARIKELAGRAVPGGRRRDDPPAKVAPC